MWPFARPHREILIVCTANICRSPAAEALLRFHLRRFGAGRRVRVRSAGTRVGAPGSSPDPRMIDIAAADGVSLRGIRAVAVDDRLLSRADRVWVMERQHLADLAAFDGARPRCELLDPAGIEVPDPFYGSRADVRAAYERLADLTYARAMDIMEELNTPRSVGE